MYMKTTLAVVYTDTSYRYIQTTFHLKAQT